MSDNKELDEYIKKAQETRIKNAERVNFILNECEHLDDDGYPTDEALEAIELWDWENHDGSKGWFDFIASIWHLKSWGWWEGECEHKDGRKYYGYAISTGGWSGNESIIRAMEDNKHSLWWLNWVSSRRGGHYEFELKELKDDE